MQVKVIHLCDKAEANVLWDEGMFHPLVKEYLDRFPRQKNKIEAIKEFKVQSGCSLLEAKRHIDQTYVNEELEILLQYSEDGAINCNSYKPMVMRKIGNVWVPICEYNEQVRQEQLFSTIHTWTLNGLDKLKPRSITYKEANNLLDSIMCGALYQISENEVWEREPNGWFHVYTAGTIKSNEIWPYFSFKPFLESRFARRKAEFGEF